MDPIHMFLQPIALLSGIGLLAISTVNRVVHAENQLCGQALGSDERSNWARTARYLRQGLQRLYLGGTTATIASLAASIAWLLGRDPVWLVSVGSCAVVAMIGLALRSLARAEQAASKALTPKLRGE
jgi:hypothetical protein